MVAHTPPPAPRYKASQTANRMAPRHRAIDDRSCSGRRNRGCTSVPLLFTGSSPNRLYRIWTPAFRGSPRGAGPHTFRVWQLSLLNASIPNSKTGVKTWVNRSRWAN